MRSVACAQSASGTAISPWVQAGQARSVFGEGKTASGSTAFRGNQDQGRQQAHREPATSRLRLRPCNAMQAPFFLAEKKAGGGPKYLTSERNRGLSGEVGSGASPKLAGHRVAPSPPRPAPIWLSALPLVTVSRLLLTCVTCPAPQLYFHSTLNSSFFSHFFVTITSSKYSV